MRATFVAVALVALFVRPGIAQDQPASGVVKELLELVRSHTRGQESFTRKDRRITIAYDAMTYQVHVPDRSGRMQRAHPEHGPRRAGVVLEIDVLARPYGGPMALPNWLRGPYYDTHCSELKDGDRHLFVRARFGMDFPVDLRRRILEKVGARDEPRPVRVEVWAVARPSRFRAGEPLALTVTLHNRLRKSIRFTTFATEPAPSNGETLSIDLVDIYRNGERRNLYVARPELKIPTTVSGPTARSVAPGEKLVVRLDVRKWKIRGGWVPGQYEVTVRMRGVRVDDRVTLSVLSHPVRFVVE
jgi:hypothetical protein